jgi:hypothetical protein
MFLRDSFISLFLFVFISSSAQQPSKNFDTASISPDYFTQLKKEFGNKKQYPPEFEKPILIALSFYPELKNTAILFRSRARHSIALTRSTWGGVLQSSGKRSYVITISDSTEDLLSPLLFKYISFNTQVGLIGHELGHVIQYKRKTTFGLIKYGVCNISAKYIDRFEYEADGICIAHGLGHQLLEWSRFVRKTMNTEFWLGPDYAHRPKTRERYMNPGTIIARMNADSLYMPVRE